MQNLQQRFSWDLDLADYAPKTKKQYLLDFKAFMTYCQTSPESMNRDDLRIWVDRLKNSSIGPSRIKQHLASVGFLYRRTLGLPEIVSFFRWPKVPFRIPVVMSIEEVKQVLEAIEGENYRMLFRTIFATGLRINEACNLKVSNIESDRGVIRIIGKNNRQREVALHDTLLSALREYWRSYRPAAPWLFTNKINRPVSSGQAQKVFRKAVRDVGLQKKATPHTLRHTYATLLLEKGSDIRIIQVLLGHKCMKSTERYLHVNTRIVRNSPDTLEMLPT